MATWTIDSQRLQSSLNEMAVIGATEGGGVTRLALTDEDRDARELLRGWFEEAGLTTYIDDLGNMMGVRRGARNAPPIVVGSHLDTVIKGGRFDGALGVLAALEIVRAMNEYGIETDLPVAIVNWTNEEGARFQPSMLGSGAAIGEFEVEYAHNRTDLDGRRFGDELNRIGYLGDRDHRLIEASAYLELHIEQGPILETVGAPVGVVEGIVSMTWLEVEISGKSDHAGTTPMTMRHDPLVAASSAIASVQAIAIDQDESGVGTVGRVQVEPNVINVIPSTVSFSVDFRHPNRAGLDEMTANLSGAVEDACRAQGVQFALDQYWASDPMPFDGGVMTAIREACEANELQYKGFWSAAGHDAKYMATICPTGMVFVRSQGGLSHAEGEYSTAEDCAAGAQVLLDATLKLANTLS